LSTIGTGVRHWVAAAAGVGLAAGLTAWGSSAAQEAPGGGAVEAPSKEWIQDDAEAAFALARETGKPLLAVFRCVP
jgi:hypothetical protein